ncbi:MAG: OmpA family protein [Candidatus Rokubacteria bacterium]|nr:OmpA family protein [Candidatus Rokubacteria bacterium]
MVQASFGQFVDLPELEDLHFDFDRVEIGLAELRALEVSVRRLQRVAPSQILAEGHTDEWGSDEYNLRLGERRARAVRDVLINRGVDRSAILTVSYGSTRPRCLEHHRVCWAENRRVHLRVWVANERTRHQSAGQS